MNRRSFSSKRRRIDSNVELQFAFWNGDTRKEKKTKFTFYEFHFKHLIKNPKSCRFISGVCFTPIFNSKIFSISHQTILDIQDFTTVPPQNLGQAFSDTDGYLSTRLHGRRTDISNIFVYPMETFHCHWKAGRNPSVEALEKSFSVPASVVSQLLLP